jgi:hypothetical protein
LQSNFNEVILDHLKFQKLKVTTSVIGQLFCEVRRPVGEKSVILILRKNRPVLHTSKSNMNNQAAPIAIPSKTNLKGKPVTKRISLKRKYARLYF